MANGEAVIPAETLSAGTNQSEKGTVGLKKNLGLFNGVAMVVGLVVGSGIFVSPVGVLQNSGSVGLSLIFWAIGGISAAIGSMCYVELGTSIPSSGGDYTYIGKYQTLQNHDRRKNSPTVAYIRRIPNMCFGTCQLYV